MATRESQDPLTTGAKPEGREKLETVPQITEAEDVLSERFSTSEPTGVAHILSSRDGAEATARSAAKAVPAHGKEHAALKGLRMLNSLRPLLPAVGGALGLVNHGAAQAAARLLPLLGGDLPKFRPDTSRQELPVTAPASSVQSVQSLERRHSALAEQVQSYQLRAAEAEEQLRRVRESLERTVSEQSALNHHQNEINDRLRLLTAGVVILMIVVLVQIFLLVMLMRR